MAFILGLVFVATTSAAACYLFARWAPEIELMANPGEHRQHLRATPVVGGLAIYAAFLISFLILDQSIVLLLPALFMMCVIGALDDRYILKAWMRFLAQAIAAYLMIEFTGVKLESLGQLLPFNSELVLGAWSTPITVFATVGVINAINMSDGSDGLAGSLVLLALGYLLLMGSSLDRILLISIAALSGFLIFNLRLWRDQAVIFLGDSGSMMLGILIAFLLIQHSQYPTGFWPVTALWVLALPLIDAVAVLIARPLRGRSPFAADHSHYHHHLASRGFKPNAVLFIALLIQSFFMLFGWLMFRMRVAESLQLLIFLSCFIMYLVYLWRWMGRSAE